MRSGVRHRRWLAPLAALAALLACACGRTVPHGGEVVGAPPPTPPPPPATPSGPDLLPRDLDLVLRVDLAQMRRGLGEGPSEELTRRALQEADPEAIVRRTLARADAVWVGLRVGSLFEGDRVLVVDAPPGTVEPDPIAWSPRPGGDDEVQQYDAATRPPRSGTARILILDDGTALFVSPVELDAVDRVLRDGPDAERGQPEARGLVSLDWRVQPPGVALQNRFPSLAALMRGVRRVRATVTMGGNELELEGRLICHSETSAGKVQRFLETFANTARQIERYEPLLRSLELRQAGNSVQVRWTLPPEAVLGLLRDDDQGENPASRH
ncbi:MAG: hypothetical protein JRI23_12310 [Deltaproteobacteria bacterium]|jgi:hypothetical protein|nr:hypothetical protein [Deltaproteobacteria bacterium]MBW2532495.1 hypothetical protein [Deltaproteobacteria bacterium]